MSSTFETSSTPVQDSETIGMMPPENGDRIQAVLRRATELYAQTPDWVTFFREIMGVGGVVHQLFPSVKEQISLEQTPEYARVQQMLARLRERKEDANNEIEPTRVITVRLPKSVHESLKAEAHNRQTSMNKLCISKLLQMIDEELVPND